MKLVLARLNLLYISVITISLLLTSQGNAKFDATSAVGLWFFDEGAGKEAKDSSEKANTGQISGAKWVDGKFDKALEFDGVDDIVDCGIAESLNIAKGSFGLWLKFGAKPSALGHAVNPLAKSEQYWIHGSSAVNNDPDNSIQVKIGVGGTRYIATTGANFIETGVWYHVFGTYDGKALKLYVDGEEEGEDTKPSGDIDKTANILAIGTWSARVDFFQGAIDEVVVTTQVLTANEIQAIFKGGLLAASPAGNLAITWGAIKIH